MPLEIEAKMRLEDITACRRRLERLGARHGMSVLEFNTYFDTPAGTLQRTNQGVRVRVERQVDGPYQAVIITHKGARNRGPLKSRPETELRVEDGDDAAALLSALGFVRRLSFEKRRDKWNLGGCEVTLDHLPLIGDFIEIEGPNDDTIMAVRRKLELSEQPLIKSSYISILRTFMVENNLSLDHIGLIEPGSPPTTPTSP